MRWSERQLAMLREMGIAFSWREPRAGAPVDSADDDEAAVLAGERSAATATSGRTGTTRAVASPAARPDDATASQGGASFVALAAADWLVVGDPFLPSDATAADQERLLDNMLAAIGVTRSAPTRTRRAAFVGLPDSATRENGKAAALLDAAIDAVRPACILALGRAAAQAVLDTDEPLGALRGRREARAGVPVIATFAPAFLLRHPVDKAKAWADLCLAVRSVEEAV
jgi:DNA polymerase